MSLARVHSTTSKRAHNDADRKVVYKSVLDNPFRIPWPTVPSNVQNAILACAVETLEGVADYHLSRDRISRRDKKARKRRLCKAILEDNGETKPEPTSRKRRKLVGGEPMHVGDQEDSMPPAPLVLKHLTFGINEITKRLERQISEQKKSLAAQTTLSISNIEPVPLQPQPEPLQSPLRVILVCRSDIDPHLIIAHIPHLVAACNSTNPKAFPKQSDNKEPEDIKLVCLPKGSELILARAAGLRRVAVLGFDASTPNIAPFLAFLASIPVLQASWLVSPKTTQELIPTHIKQLRTSTPKDSKGAKESRRKSRKEAKAKRQGLITLHNSIPR